MAAARGDLMSRAMLKLTEGKVFLTPSSKRSSTPVSRGARNWVFRDMGHHGRGGAKGEGEGGDVRPDR